MNTLILDDHARGILMTMLAGIPALLADLEITLTRAHRLGASTPVGRCAPGPRLPFHAAASEAIDHLEVVLRVFTATLSAGRATPPDPVGQARWLLAALPGIPGDHPGLEGIERAFTAAVSDGFAVIDRPADRLYLGLCEECGLAVFAMPEQRRARCACGTEVEVDARREQMLVRARYRYGTAAELARLLPWFVGLPITEAAIAKAGERWRKAGAQLGGPGIPCIKVDGHVLYRVGDVVDWHTARHAGGVDG